MSPVLQVVHVGTDVVFIYCNTNYKSVIEWTFNNQSLPSDVQIEWFSSIIIRNVQIHHNGTYRCRFTAYGGQKEMWGASELYVGG